MGTGQYINTFMPYQMPPMVFGGLQNFAPLSSNSGSAKEAEEKRIKEEREKAAEEFNKRLELMKQRAENAPKFEAQIKEIEEGKKELEDQLNKAKNGKVDEDGIIIAKETWKDYEKLPMWKKCLRAAGAMFMDAPIKLAEGFVGYETNPETGVSEWNWKKGLKNAAIAVGCIALTAVPVAGPIISAGLLATGAVFGAVGAGKGIYNATQAKTPEELEQAYQDIGTGVLIGAASVAGLRGLGKTAQVSAASSNTTSALQSSWKTSVTEFFKDATVNAYKATAQSVKSQSCAVSANGFWKTFGTNLKEAVPFGKSRFEKANYETNQSINTRLNEINQELNSTNLNPLKKALLEQEKIVLDAQKAELRGAVTKDSWNALKTNSEVHKNMNSLQSAVKDIKANGNITIDGNTYNMSKDNLKALQDALSHSKELSKEIQNLVKTRKSTIRQMASMNKHKSEVEAYTGNVRGNRLTRLYDTVKINKSDITWKKAVVSPFKMAWESLMLAFKPWNYLKNSPATTVYKVEETVTPRYSLGFLSSGLIGEAFGMGNRAMTTKIFAKNEEGKDIEEVVPVTKEVVAQMEEQLNQYDEAIAKVQNELNQLYIA